MKGFHFEANCADAVFWISENGEISQTFVEGWIGVIQTDPKNNPSLLMNMLAASKFKAGQVTAEYLNNIG